MSTVPLLHLGHQTLGKKNQAFGIHGSLQTAGWEQVSLTDEGFAEWRIMLHRSQFPVWIQQRVPSNPSITEYGRLLNFFLKVN